jgi:thiol-disulfide isomerase/thioredoxin
LVFVTSATSRTTFLLGALGAGVAVCSPPARAVSGGGARPGEYCAPLRKGVQDMVYDFALYLLDGDGRTFELSSTLGKGVWLNFFASWCGPCNAESASVVELAERYAPAGLSTIGIDVGERPEPVRTYRDKYKISFPIALDSTSSVFKSFGFQALPTHVFFDRSGRLTCVVPSDLTLREMDNEIGVALSRSIPAVATPAQDEATTAPSPQD